MASEYNAEDPTGYWRTPDGLWVPHGRELPPFGSSRVCRFVCPESAERDVVIGVCKLVGNPYRNHWQFGPHVVEVVEWLFAEHFAEAIEPRKPVMAESPKPMTEVSVYLDSGVVYFYSVSDRIKGREHAAAIIRTGYRHTPEGSDDLEWFPPHRIVKVKVAGGGALSVYKDQVRPT